MHRPTERDGDRDAHVQAHSFLLLRWVGVGLEQFAEPRDARGVERTVLSLYVVNNIVGLSGLYFACMW